MLIRFGCVLIGPRCTYSVPLRFRPPVAANCVFFATVEKSVSCQVEPWRTRTLCFEATAKVVHDDAGKYKCY